MDAGLTAYGHTEQRWALERACALVERCFGASCSLKGMNLVPHRMGWSVQVPAHRAAERDERAVRQWRERVWPLVKRPPTTWAPGSSSKTRPGSLPHRRRGHLGRRGCTLVVRASGRRPGGVSAAVLCCCHPGHGPRFFQRTHVYHRGSWERASFTEADYIHLVDTAHRVLGAPIALLWDDHSSHTARWVGRELAAREWLSVVRLPKRAPELNRSRRCGHT